MCKLIFAFATLFTCTCAEVLEVDLNGMQQLLGTMGTCKRHWNMPKRVYSYAGP